MAKELIYVLLLFHLITCRAQTTTTRGATTSNDTTTESVPRDIIDAKLPVPTDLKKVTSRDTVIIIRFRPPRNNSRYTHFRIEYESKTESKYLEVQKDVQQVHLLGLRSGVLYQISVRTQGQDSFGNYLLSSKSPPIKARTLPPAVSNLRIVPVENKLSEVMVVWDGVPTPIKGPKYDRFTLSYTIIDESNSAQESKYPKQSIDISYEPTSAFDSTSATNVTQLVTIELGATYKFSVVTESLGEYPTKSSALDITHEFAVPGPINASVLSYDNTSISIKWDIHEGITNIFEHIISYKPVSKDERISNEPKNISLPTNTLQYDITGLLPGILYVVSLKCLREEVPFGKESEETEFFARTSPSLPDKINFQSITMNKAFISIQLKENSTDSIIIEYESLKNNRIKPTRLSYASKINNFTIEGLSPGELYMINVSIVTEIPIQTTSSLSMLARTTPEPPKKFSGSGQQGKIVLRWQKPNGLETPTLWKYEVVYYPAEAPNEITRIFVWNRDGDTKMTYAIDRLSPAILYKVFLYCVVGEDSENNRVARSAATGPLSLFTQPNNPILTGWTQVTLAQVKIEWTAVQHLDYYLLNLTRLYKSGSSIEFNPESLSYNIDKDKTNVILKLSLGAKYRVVLTAVVEKENTWMQSVVNSSNTGDFETWSPYDSHQFFFRLVWRFTNCDKLGRFGPSQRLCDFAYEDTPLDNLVTVDNGIQNWLAPIEGLYRVTAIGAGYQGPGGKGATVSGLFHLKEGAKVKIGVGQQGNSYGDMMQGGAGGTFVVTGDGTDEPMVVAGGAGTAFAGAPPLSISDGRLNHSAGDASSVAQGFGRGGTEQSMGPGLPGISTTSGGAGFYGTTKSAVVFGDTATAAVGIVPYSEENGVNETDISNTYIPLAGGRYEEADGSFSEGGFGGGGSGYKTAAGGGGGYTGGGGGPANGYSGGGGSYIKYTGGAQYAEVENDGPGMVEITLVGLPVSSPIPVTLYLVVSFLVGIAMTVGCGGIMVWVDKCMGRRMLSKRSETNVDVRENKPYTLQVFETSVHVTDASPTSSGLYVKNVNDEESYRKYSEVDSADHMPKLTVHVPRELQIPENTRNDDSIVHKNPAIYDEDLSSSDEDSKSESSASSISSIKSDLEDLTRDVYAWDINDDDDESDYSSERDTYEQQIGEESLPPPPPPPPLDGLTTEEHRQNYRKNRLMFDNLENSMSF